MIIPDLRPVNQLVKSIDGTLLGKFIHRTVRYIALIVVSQCFVWQEFFNLLVKNIQCNRRVKNQLRCNVVPYGEKSPGIILIAVLFTKVCKSHRVVCVSGASLKCTGWGEVLIGRHIGSIPVINREVRHLSVGNRAK